MTEINPYGIPAGTHPFVKYLVRVAGIRLDGDVLQAIAEHLDQVGFIHLGEEQIRLEDITINVGLPDKEAHVVTEPGQHVEWTIPDGWRSHCRVAGSLPPGIDIVGDKITGTCAMPGIWTVTIIIGPAIKFDSLGNGGAPLEDGEWIDVDQPRQVPVRAASGVSLSGLCREELEDVIAQAEAAKKDLEVQP